jgi:hypothetical protein
LAGLDAPPSVIKDIQGIKNLGAIAHAIGARSGPCSPSSGTPRAHDRIAGHGTTRSKPGADSLSRNHPYQAAMPSPVSAETFIN